jgi:6-phosphogluconolactonase (cycloisomerase 2 family)
MSRRQLGVYTYDQAGKLTFVRAVPNSGLAICWITIDRNARFLYTSNTADNSVSVYDLSNPLNPVEIQNLKLRNPGPPLPLVPPSPALFYSGLFQLTLDPTGRFLYVVSHETTLDNSFPAGNQVHILRVGRDGRLTEPNAPVPLPVPANAHPQGVVAL